MSSEPGLRQFGVSRVDLDPDPVAAVGFGGYRYGARTHERVEDDAGSPLAVRTGRRQWSGRQLPAVHGLEGASPGQVADGADAFGAAGQQWAADECQGE